eukprot:TRINITY_DN987_c0_g2_i1.p1 TRINITY_DN987_c0_g2~~TRINITY_DN987_c0_g2_i1.p1  ORF type:complete len:738 (-),score=434.05 TRINITY_DN987_c0_g2_i1:309-2522(-)
MSSKLSSLKVIDLRKLLEKYGLPRNGLKNEMVERLSSYYEENGIVSDEEESEEEKEEEKENLKSKSNLKAKSSTSSASKKKSEYDFDEEGEEEEKASRRSSVSQRNAKKKEENKKRPRASVTKATKGKKKVESSSDEEEEEEKESKKSRPSISSRAKKTVKGKKKEEEEEDSSSEAMEEEEKPKEEEKEEKKVEENAKNEEKEEKTKEKIVLKEEKPKEVEKKEENVKEKEEKVADSSLNEELKRISNELEAKKRELEKKSEELNVLSKENQEKEKKFQEKEREISNLDKKKREKEKEAEEKIESLRIEYEEKEKSLRSKLNDSMKKSKEREEEISSLKKENEEMNNEREKERNELEKIKNEVEKNRKNEEIGNRIHSKRTESSSQDDLMIIKKTLKGLAAEHPTSKVTFTESSERFIQNLFSFLMEKLDLFFAKETVTQERLKQFIQKSFEEELVKYVLADIEACVTSFKKGENQPTQIVFSASSFDNLIKQRFRWTFQSEDHQILLISINALLSFIIFELVEQVYIHSDDRSLDYVTPDLIWDCIQSDKDFKLAFKDYLPIALNQLQSESLDASLNHFEQAASHLEKTPSEQIPVDISMMKKRLDLLGAKLALEEGFNRLMSIKSSEVAKEWNRLKGITQLQESSTQLLKFGNWCRWQKNVFKILPIGGSELTFTYINLAVDCKDQEGSVEIHVDFDSAPQVVLLSSPNFMINEPIYQQVQQKLKVTILFALQSL